MAFAIDAGSMDDPRAPSRARLSAETLDWAALMIAQAVREKHRRRQPLAKNRVREESADQGRRHE